MIQPADVTKIKCIIQGALIRKIDIETYSVLCKKDTVLNVINLGKKLLFLYLASPTVCKGLECSILDFIESYTEYCINCEDPCIRRIIDTNVN